MALSQVLDFIGRLDGVGQDQEGQGQCVAAPPLPVVFSPLLQNHISPLVEKRASVKLALGGSLVQVYVPYNGPPRACPGKRGRIKGFSPSSRRGFFRQVHSLDQSQVERRCTRFITLTYPARFPTPAAAKRDLDAFLKRFRRAFGRQPGWWKLEPQERGAPHFHIALLMASDSKGADVLSWVVQNWHDIAGQGDENHRKFHAGLLGNRPCVEVVTTYDQLVKYLGKYIGKSVESQAGWDWPGRFWAQIAREELKALCRIVVFEAPMQLVNMVKRVCRKYIEHQPTGVYRISLSRGRVIDRRRLSQDEKQMLVRSAHFRSICRPYHRRVRFKSGGITAFMPCREYVRVFLYFCRELGMSPPPELLCEK